MAQNYMRDLYSKKLDAHRLIVRNLKIIINNNNKLKIINNNNKYSPIIYWSRISRCVDLIDQ